MVMVVMVRGGEDALLRGHILRVVVAAPARHCSHLIHRNTNIGCSAHYQGKRCVSSLVSMRIRLQGSKPKKKADLDPGQILPSQKVIFYMKNVLYVGHQTHQRGYKSLFKSRKSGIK
jgi:hypothetical protein